MKKGGNSSIGTAQTDFRCMFVMRHQETGNNQNFDYAFVSIPVPRTVVPGTVCEMICSKICNLHRLQLNKDLQLVLD